MPAERMNRQEFFAKLSKLDEDGLARVLWNVYWRGSAPVRERIESELDPAERDRRKRAAAEPADPEWVLYEVREFAGLARAGAYIAGDRRVSPKERSRWRMTFRRLATDAQSALRAQDADAAEEALALIIDLACETRGREYFRSEDPVEAARFVVSDAVAMLWETMRDRHGFQNFAEPAAAQLIRWESKYGWTRGWGQIRARETSLESVLTRMLRAPDTWTVFADRYLDALDEVAGAESAKGSSRRSREHDHADYARRDRTANLAKWHDRLLGRLAGSDAEDRLDRLAEHAALGGPELIFVQARLAHSRGDIDRARKLAQDCLRDLPGHQAFALFAPRSAPTFRRVPRNSPTSKDDGRQAAATAARETARIRQWRAGQPARGRHRRHPQPGDRRVGGQAHPGADRAVRPRSHPGRRVLAMRGVLGVPFDVLDATASTSQGPPPTGGAGRDRRAAADVGR